mgnify:CR=1 FL=1
MNRDLKDLATIIESLPQNIGHFSVFMDNKSGEFIFSSDTVGDNPFENISNLFNQHIEDGVVDNTMELFRSNLYALFFSFAQHEGFELLNEFKESIEEIIEDSI